MTAIYVLYFFDRQTQIPTVGDVNTSHRIKQASPPSKAVNRPEVSHSLEHNLKLASQADTQVDGSLRVSKSGDLIIEAGVIDLFNYFFTASGEMKIVDIQDRIHQYIESHLEQKSATQAKKLLSQYIMYQEAEQAFQQSLGARPHETQAQFLNKIDDLLHWRKDKQQEIFSESANKLFQAEEYAYDQFMLQRMQSNEESLSPAEKSLELEKYIADLPPQLHQAVKQQLNIKEQIALEQAVQALGEEEKQAQRDEQQLSQDVQTALQQLDKKNLDLQNRVEQYAMFKQSLDVQNLEGEEERLQIEQFEKSIFSQLELKRLPYLQQALSK